MYVKAFRFFAVSLIAMMFMDEATAADLKPQLLGHTVECLNITAYRFRNDGAIDVLDTQAQAGAVADHIANNRIVWNFQAVQFPSAGPYQNDGFYTIIYLDDKGRLSINDAGLVSNRCQIYKSH